MEREIHICADDFGMNAHVDAGIVSLALCHRLTGTSCLVDGPLFEQDIAQLQATGIKIGLHLNFTESLGQEGPLWPLRTIIMRSLARSLPASAISASIERQLQRFERVTGHLPHYIDGHQHVHQLPQIRSALLTILQRRYAGMQLPWIRHGGNARSAGFPLALSVKAHTIAVLGSGALRREATTAGFPMNNGFCGVYDFSGGQEAYLRWIALWLAQCKNGDALMCHPAKGIAPDDMLGAQRQDEFAVLSSDALDLMLGREQVRIAAANVI
ncbi:ChbG/HpnK family deacetylase [Allopusillimonas ginsengisoli]|nr:ChbG/HpnK family deacetylase [Allopusillimonas ginsengisoli]